MPRQSKGAHLWLRPASRDATGKLVQRARWIIKDGGRQISTGCSERDRQIAETKLASYISSKYDPARRERPLGSIPVPDVLKIYLSDVSPGQARPEKAVERVGRLNEYFGTMTLDQITGATCRSYTATRGRPGGARRDLQDLAAAINHHSREGFHRGTVRVVLPPRGKARQRWLTRAEFARLLMTCWRTRETQEGHGTKKRPLRHLCRLLLIGVYTGSRPGAILNATWRDGPGLSFVDTANGLFYRHASGEEETDKRQPPVRLSARLLAHMRRWERMDAARRPAPLYVVNFGGSPILSAKTALGRATALCGLQNVTAYSLRHTAASWLVAKGLPTRMVADFLGTSEAMILAHYGHLSPGYQDRAALEIGRK